VGQEKIHGRHLGLRTSGLGQMKVCMTNDIRWMAEALERWAPTSRCRTLADTLVSETRSCQCIVVVCHQSIGLSWAPRKTAFIGSDLAHEIPVGNAAGMITVRMKTGANRTSSPNLANEKLLSRWESFLMSSRSYGIRLRRLHTYSRGLGFLYRVVDTEA